VLRKGKAGLLQLGMGFHPDLSGRDNVYLNGALLGLKKREVDALFDTIVDFSELHSHIDLHVKNYPSGMYSRLGFAIAINILPDILLIDEMLATGDEKFRIKCYEKLQEVRDQGKTIIFVSHSMAEVVQLCEKAICLEDGKILREGASREVTEFYLKHISR